MIQGGALCCTVLHVQRGLKPRAYRGKLSHLGDPRCNRNHSRSDTDSRRTSQPAHEFGCKRSQSDKGSCCRVCDLEPLLLRHALLTSYRLRDDKCIKCVRSWSIKGTMCPQLEHHLQSPQVHTSGLVHDPTWLAVKNALRMTQRLYLFGLRRSVDDHLAGEPVTH